MHPILAEIVADDFVRGSWDRAPERRQKSRRRLRLCVPSYRNLRTSRAIIHDLSQIGLMLETNAPLSVGDKFEIELPKAGVIAVQVAWSMEGRFGCRFETPVSKAAVSASLLRSAANQPANDDCCRVLDSADTTFHSGAGRSGPIGLLATEFSLLLLIFVVSLFLFTLASLPISAEGTVGANDRASAAALPSQGALRENQW